MKHMKIELQYEPASMQDIVELSSEEESLETLKTETEITAAAETGLVDFYINAPAIDSLKEVHSWSRIMVVCTALFVAIQLIITAATLISSSKQTLSPLALMTSLSMGANLSLNIYLLWQSNQFNRKINRALKFTDNTSLAEAFAHQALFFKWLFLSIVISFGFILLSYLLLP